MPRNPRTIGRVRVCKRRVRRDVDAVLFMPIDPVSLLKVWMELELVERRLDRRVLNEVLDLVRVEIGDPNVPDFASVEKLFHGVPSLGKEGQSMMTVRRGRCHTSR